MLNKITILTMSILSVIMITSFAIPSYSDYMSPKKQLDSGVLSEDIQCRDDRVLVLRTNGSPACVTERTVERTGWKILKTEFIQTEKLVTPEQVIPTIIMIDQSSDVEFVDDGREISYKSAGGISSPHNMYQIIIGKQIKHSEFQNDGDGNITLTAVPHEKYSLKADGTFYLEDFLPQYVPEGYKLLVSYTGVSSAGDVSLRHHYVPTTFELTEDTNSADMLKSKGFTVSAFKTTHERSIENSIEQIKENTNRFGGHYGDGFVDMYRDGKLIYAYSGGTSHHFYQSTLMMYSDDYTSFTVSSYYHNLDEILPIFNSVGN